LSRRTQQILAFTFGVVFVFALLFIAFKVGVPTPFQYTIFRVVLALAAAGVAAMIPGFIHANIADWLRAGGALAVFVVVYFTNPAAQLRPAETEPDPTDQFTILLACMSTSSVTVDSYTFPYADIKRNDAGQGMAALIAQLPNQKCKQDGSSIFRVKDEAVLGPGGSAKAADGGNLGVISIPPEVINDLGGNHLAFTKVYSLHQKR
jgi:hypothetical protein